MRSPRWNTTTFARQSGCALLAFGLGLLGGCKGGSKAAGAAGDGAADAHGDAGLASCPEGDGGVLSAAAVQDDFGPNATAAKMASALGRVNIYEATNARTLERVEVYLATPLAASRLTLAIHEAAAMTMAFHKLTDVQVDVSSCLGWAASGPLAVPLVAGRFYAIGFDPNQSVVPYVDAEMDDLPIDGRIGRLMGSKTATSVSVPSLTWDKVVTTEFTRQRLSTSPRIESDAGSADPADGGADGRPDALATDAPRDAAAGADAVASDGGLNDAPAGDASRTDAAPGGG